jgi:acyl-coenzyme A thioesterase PaaI-like protein
MPLHPGRTVARAEARIVDGEGRLVAHATAAWLVMRLDDQGPAG